MSRLTMIKTPPPRSKGSSRSSRSRWPVVLVVLLAVGAVVAIALGTGSVGGATASPSEQPSLPASQSVPVARFTLHSETRGAATAWLLPGGAQPGDVLPVDGAVWTTDTTLGTVSVLRGSTLTRYLLPKAFQDPATFRLAAGSDGDVWFTGYPGAGIGRIRADGTANYFDQVSAETRTSVAVGAGPDGSFWVTDPLDGALVRIHPGVPASVDRFVVSAPQGVSGKPQPYEIRAGSDGAMWFTDPNTNAVGRATLDGSSIIERTYNLGTQSPRGIAAGPDGSLWVALTPAPARLLRIDPATGDGSVVDIRDATTGIQQVAVASDGTLWVSQGTYALHVRPDGTTIEKVPYPARISISDTGIEVAQDGTVWVAALESSALIEIRPSR